MSGIGYTHALFSGVTLDYAKSVDHNSNGLIDGNEIKEFTDKVKKETGVIFNFNNVKQSEVKLVDIKDKNNNYIFNTVQELVQGVYTKDKDGKSKLVRKGYLENGALQRSTMFLNGGDPFRAFKNKQAKIAYLSKDDMKTSTAAVQHQEARINESLQNKYAKKQAEIDKKNEEERYWREECNDPISKFLKWLGF